MPIYEYTCKACGREFERLVLPHSSDPIACPHCRTENVERIVSTFGCAGVNLDKRLRMDSEEQMRSGQKMLAKEKLRKRRIKIL